MLKTPGFCLACIARMGGLLMLALWAGSLSAEESVEKFMNMSLSELLSMEITSVSRKKQTLSEVAAAVSRLPCTTNSPTLSIAPL